MIPIASGVRVWIATGHTDMRRGMNSLGLLVQEAFKRDPHGGDLYVLRGRSGKLIKILWHDGLGMSLWSAAASCGRRRLMAYCLWTRLAYATLPRRCGRGRRNRVDRALEASNRCRNRSCALDALALTCTGNRRRRRPRASPDYGRIPHLPGAPRSLPRLHQRLGTTTKA